MIKEQKVNFTLTELEALRKLRQQLAEFNPAEGTIEVIFNLPEGQSVRVPVASKVKTRLISKEIRNYLAEEQLSLQCREE